MRKMLPFIAVSASLALAGCGGGGTSSTPVATAPAAPTQTPTSYDVTPCLNQQVAPGVTVANLVVPDTLKIDLSKPAGFPNGRLLSDPVIDITLAVIFLDLTKHGADTFAKIPLDPLGNDVPLLTSFPYFAPPQGNPTLADATGTSFNFRPNAAADYVRVDRMGMPAVSTALISAPNKNAYNDDNPAQDATGKWVNELTSTLRGLTNALADDLVGLKLTPCAKPA